MRLPSFSAWVDPSRPLARWHKISLGLLVVHALFLMMAPTLIRSTDVASPEVRPLLILGVTAMLGAGMILFFLYSKWISPAKGNALIQAVNVTLGTMLLVAVFEDEVLAGPQWLGIFVCAAGIMMMISRGESELFLFPTDAEYSAETTRLSPLATLRLLVVGVGIATLVWLATLDLSRLEASVDGLDAMLSDPANALPLFAFEVAATTLVPLVAKVAADLRPSWRVGVSLTSLAILGISLMMAFYYVRHLAVSETNAVLQTTNTLVGTLLVAALYTDERLSARQMAGAVICTLGMMLTLDVFSGSFDLYRPSA